MSKFAFHTSRVLSVLFLLLINSQLLQAEFRFIEHVVTDTFTQAATICTADLDGDGDIDIFAGGSRSGLTAWFENDGTMQFTQHTIEADFSPRHVMVADLDGDQDMDPLAASYFENGILWWENEGGGQLTEYVISDTTANAHTLDVCDFDDDGDQDVLCAAWNMGLLLFTNDGEQNFTQHFVGALNEGASCVNGVDMDGDGDFDVLGTLYLADKVSWWEDGVTEHVITNSLEGAHWSDAADFDLDGDMDVVCAAFDAGKVMLYVNDGAQGFSQIQISSLGGATWISADDMDADGDSDLLVAGDLANDLIWYENLGGNSFIEHKITGSFNNAYGAYVADIDLDNDIDVLGAAMNSNTIAWWENDYNHAQAVDLIVTPMSAVPGEDVVVILAEVRNIENHSLSVNLTLTSEDSSYCEVMALYDDELHSDGLADDGNWGNSFTAPTELLLYSLDVEVTDLDGGTVNTGINMGAFTTVGPLVFNSFQMSSTTDPIINPGEFVSFYASILNEGGSGQANAVEVELVLSDPLAAFRGGLDRMTRPFPDIAAGTVELGSRTYSISVDEEFDADNDLLFQVNIYSHGHLCWTDEATASVEPPSSIHDQNSSGPEDWVLHEPYPNPFNPTTTVHFELPERSHMVIVVMDILGRKVATLANTDFPAGSHRVFYHPENLSSGTYYLRVSSSGFGDYVRKIVYLK